MNPDAGLSANIVGDFELADFDGDTHPDIGAFVWNGQVAKLAVFRYDAANPRQFHPIQLVDLGSVTGTTLAAGDLTGEGIPDLAIYSRKLPDQTFGERLSVYPGNGDGTFAAPVTTQPGLAVPDDQIGLRDLETADVDADGRLDLVGYRGPTFVMRGNGDGTFAAVQTTAGDADQDLTLADLNGDDLLDLVGDDVPRRLGAGRQR